MSTGTCTIHSWNDGADDDESGEKLGRRVNHQLESDPMYYGRNAGRRSTREGLRSRTVAQAAEDDDEDIW